MKYPSFSKIMKYLSALCLAWCVSVATIAQKVTPEKRILVFSKTAGYRHKSIEAGIAALTKMGAEKKFTVEEIARLVGASIEFVENARKK